MNGCENDRSIYRATNQLPTLVRSSYNTLERRKPRRGRVATGIIAVSQTRVTPVNVRSIRFAAVLSAATLVGISALGALDAAAQATEAAPSRVESSSRQLLNSERIAARFGNYGIEVLASDPRERVSNLYSEANGERTCRTFAVVRYPAAVDPALAAEHDEIVRGGSIGAVFAAHGWQVQKTNLRYFEIGAPGRVAGLMRVAAGTRLAAHAYELDVAKAGRMFQYALLVEIHHPDYLKRDDLQTIYGPTDPSDHEAVVAELIGAALAAAGAASDAVPSPTGTR